MAFDLEGARKEGYSDTEIADYLAGQQKFDIAGARKEGYQDAEIIQHLVGSAKPAGKGIVQRAKEEALNLVGPPIGATEAALAMGTGIVNPTIADIIAFPKTVISGRPEGRKLRESIDRALPVYEPKTELGQKYTSGAGSAMERVFGAPGEVVGGGVERITGSPATGAFAKGFFELGTQALLGGMAARGLRGKTTAPKSLAEIERTGQLAPTEAEIIQRFRERYPTEQDVIERFRGYEPTEAETIQNFRDWYEGIPQEPVALPRWAEPMPPSGALGVGEIASSRELLSRAEAAKKPPESYVKGKKGKFAKVEKETPKPIEPEPTPQVEPQPLLEGEPTTIPKVETKISPEAKTVEPALIEAKPEGIVSPEIEGQAQNAVTGATVTQPSTEGGFVNIPQSIAGQIKSAAPKVWQHIKEFFSPTSTLAEGGEWYKDLRQKGLGSVDRVIGIGEKVFDKLKPLPDDAKFNIFQAVDNKIPMDKLSSSERFIAEQMSRLNDRIGKMLVDRGMMTQETFDAHKGQYVRYLYLRHVLPDDAKVGISGGKLDLQYLKERKDLTREQQRAIGLIEDISIAEPYGVMTSLSDIAKWDFFDKLAQDSRAVWTPGMVTWEGKKIGIGKLASELENQRAVVAKAPNVPEAQARLATLEKAMDQAKAQSGNVPEGYIQMPESKSYGNLSGAFVPKPIAQDLLATWAPFGKTASTSRLLNELYNMERKGMAMFKVGKTAFNLPTVARNVGSNFIQLNMSGIPAHQIPIYLERALVSMWKHDAYWNQARRRGLFKTNWGTGEISEVLGDVRGAIKDRTGIFGMARKLAKYYGKIDDVTKMAKFIEQVEKGVGYDKAAIEGNKWGMDYTLAHPLIKTARQHIAPFISYQYKITPLIAETLARTKDIGGVPVPTGALTIAKYAALPYIATEAAKQVLQLNDADWQRLRKQLPLYIRENQTYTLIPWKSPQGRAQWVNLEYFMPWQNFVALGSDVVKGKWGDLPRDFGVSNPFLSTLGSWSMKGEEPLKDFFTRRPVYNTLDSPTEKAFKVAEWLGQTWGIPAMFSSRGAAGYTEAAAKGRQDRYGRTVSPEQAIGRWFGVNIISPSPQQAERERGAIQAELNASLAQILKDPSMSSVKKLAAQREYQARIRELNK